ncbi:MAG: hypothetical protein PWQ67_208 [Clostridia bacterium]|nr:hypothetical protein [Clostridia bacterium]MDN5321754.1 hypothetical protein [Clostridia bacterium]
MIEALYVHIPFCEAKCYYCDFISFPQCSEELKEKYINTLKKEALNRLGNLNINLKSVFIGGGTPTCLSGGLLAHFIEFLKENFPLNSPVEISVEANPGTIDRVKLNLLKNAGVNRVSLGVQSFCEKLLENVGRIHTPEDIYISYKQVREVGFNNINIDLMYGLPGQSLPDWKETLQRTIQLNPEHISLYQLKIEEGTPFGLQLSQGILTEFDDELALEMYKIAREYLARAGYIHYEISNFAKTGYKCIHNQMYWLNQPYLGLGVGAHSYLPPRRIENLGNLRAYIKSIEQGQLPPSRVEEITLEIAMTETMFMGLRLIEGINLIDFQVRFGQDARLVFKRAIHKCLSLGLVELNNNHLKLTEKGLFLGNIVFQEFLLD